MRYSFALLSFIMPMAAVGQSSERMEDVMPDNFAGPSPTEITDETKVTFRYAPKKGSTTTSDFGNNFTWYCKTERKVRIYLNDSIINAGIAIQLNPRIENLEGLSGVLYSLVGNKVNREKLGRKVFEKSSANGNTIYRAALNSAFKNDIFELTYSIERPYVAENVGWNANELYGKGKARLEFLAPEYMEYDFRYVNLKAEDYTFKEENIAGYMTISVFGDAAGKAALKDVNINYQIIKKTFITQQGNPNTQRGVVAMFLASKPLRLR